METVDRAGPGVLAGVFLGGLGSLSRHIDRQIDQLPTLSDADVRHLEQHAAR